MSPPSDSNTRVPFRIVVGLDFTDAGDFAFRQAAQIARGVPGCELHLVHVDAKEPSAENRILMADRLRGYANDEAAASGGLPGVTIGIHLRSGKPVREIVQLVTELGAGLVVLGTAKGPHLKSWLVGSTAEQLLAAAPCPVLISGPRPREPAPQEPTIEPPCPDCVAARASSGGAEWWCARHTEHARKIHAFSYQREIPFATLDASVIPTGIKF